MRRVTIPALLLITLLTFEVADEALPELELPIVTLAIAANADHTTDRLLKAAVPGADSFSEKAESRRSTEPTEQILTAANKRSLVTLS